MTRQIAPHAECKPPWQGRLVGRKRSGDVAALPPRTFCLVLDWFRTAGSDGGLEERHGGSTRAGGEGADWGDGVTVRVFS